MPYLKSVHMTQRLCHVEAYNGICRRFSLKVCVLLRD